MLIPLYLGRAGTVRVNDWLCPSPRRAMRPPFLGWLVLLLELIAKSGEGACRFPDALGFWNFVKLHPDGALQNRNML